MGLTSDSAQGFCCIRDHVSGALMDMAIEIRREDWIRKDDGIGYP